MTPDGVVTLLSNVDLFWLVTSFAGGMFGAMIGANYAFAFTGVTIFLGLGVIAATGNAVVLDYVSFGPAFGPHIAFAGGVAAAAYAASKKVLDTGRDVNTQLVGLNRPDALLMGGLFGVIGFIIQRVIEWIPWFGSHTDSVALTVLISGILVRLLFGKTPVFHGSRAPEGEHRWLEWQEKPGQLFTIALGASLFAAGIAMVIGAYILPAGAVDDTYATILDNAHVLPFAISAITIFFLAQGAKMPVTHHITITAALAAVTFFKISGNGFVGLIVGVAFGMFAAFGAELWARLTYYYGDTHIDPPAAIIWMSNTLIALVALGWTGW